MQIQRHLLRATAPGTRREITSLHFGTPGSGPKAVLQASLHADEIPPMLVAQHLRQRLQSLERAGRVRGEIVLIPAANPIGMSQRLLEQPVGRFELASGENFNRHFVDLFATLEARLQTQPDEHPPALIARLRAQLRQACDELPVHTELQSLRQVLLALAIDADTVLDLHSDNQAILHLYTTPALWPAVEPLARALHCPLALLADGSGDNPFDEACSLTWQRIAARVGAMAGGAGLAHALGVACVAATVELRGEAEVDHALAHADANALLHFLALRGHLVPDDDERVAAPSASVLAQPLAGSIPVAAPTGGVLVYLRELGTMLARDDAFAEVIDPVDGTVATVRSPVDGLFFARESRRFVAPGTRIAKISGKTATRTGKLMSA